MAEIGNVTIRVDAVITDEQYHEAMSAVSAANEYIAALEARNAKLREERNRLLMNVSPTASELRRVRSAWKKDRDENAKLRELVEDMLSCIEIRAAFNRPPTTEMYEEFAQQARELEVEVDR